MDLNTILNKFGNVAKLYKLNYTAYALQGTHEI